MITISTYLKNPVSCLTDFSQPYSNESENKNNVASCLWSISDRTNASTEKIYTSYESPNTQLLWAQGTRVWHTHGGPTPTSLQKFYIFSFWGCGGHVRLMKWKNNVLYEISQSDNPKNHWLYTTVSLNRRACGHVDVGTCPHQVLAATLTLSQPGGQIMPTLYWCPHQVLKATGAPVECFLLCTNSMRIES